MSGGVNNSRTTASLALPYTHWVFDLDGTLTVHQHDFDHIRAELGIPPGRLILEYLETQPPALAAGLRQRLDQLEADLVDVVAIAAGARATVELLAARGARLGILTRNTRDNALTTLDNIGLADYFPPSAVLGRAESAPKPAPDGIWQLLGDWRAERTSCVMVGDFRLDLEAGRNAGVATAHIAAAGADAWPELTDHRYESLTVMARHLAGARG